MEFIIKRCACKTAYNQNPNQPHPNAYRGTYSRTYSNPRSAFKTQDYFDHKNARLDESGERVLWDEEYEAWFIKFDTLDELINFCKEYANRVGINLKQNPPLLVLHGPFC